MKFWSLAVWDYDESLEGLLFFVQRIDEMLFDYTLDSYKASALNAPFLCIEALDIINDIEKGIIDRTNLSHILEELIWSINKDDVSKSLLEINKDYYLNNPSDRNINVHKTKLELLLKAISPKKYLRKTEKLLLSAIESCNEKKKIDFLTKTYLTTLRNLGYHSSFIYSKIHDYFYFNKDKRITKLEDIKDFFKFFSLQMNKYEVVFITSELFSKIESSCKVFDLEISDKIEITCETAYDFNEIKNADQIFVSVKDVEALDIHSARESAERRIELLANLFVIFHHKEKSKWQNTALIIDTNSNEVFSLTPPISPMKRGSDLRPESAASQLNKMLKSFSLAPDSFIKFDRLIDLHGLAIENEVIENQLLNLWTAFETILPSNPKKSKIKNIIDNLIPFLNIDYVYILMDRLTRDLVNWNRRELHNILKRIPENENFNLTEKVTYLLVAENNKELKEELFEKIGKFVLLRNRCYVISENFKDTKSVFKILQNHEKKVAWQLRRIYRTRNLIVHKSSKPIYTNILIENAHYYLDLLVSKILELASDKNIIDSINQAVEFVKMKENDKSDFLKSDNHKCNRNNFTKILFGYEK